MQVKTNDATMARPQGNRPIDASNMLLDIDNYLQTLKSEDQWKQTDKNAITLFKSEGLTMVLVGLKQHAVVDDYNKGGIASIQVLQGEILFNADGQEQSATPSQMIITHRVDSYYVRATQESFLLLTIYA